MNFTGQLSSFSVSALMLMLAHEQKTGVLSIRNSTDQEIKIFTKDGVIHSAASATRRRPLLSILVEKEELNPEELPQEISAQGSDIQIGNYLIRQGLVRRKMITAALITQMEDLVYEALEWRDGAFDFTELPTLPEALMAMNEVGRTFLNEGFKDPKRLQRLLPVLHDLDCYPNLTEGLNLVRIKRSLTLDELFLLCTLSPSRSLRSILSLRDTGLLDLCESLVMLASEGYVRFAFHSDSEEVNLSNDRNAALAALALSLMDFLVRESETRQHIIQNLEAIVPGIGATVMIPELKQNWSQEPVVPFDEQELGPDLDRIISTPVSDEAVESVDDESVAPAEVEPQPLEPIEVPIEPVAGSSGEAFPWFEIAQPAPPPEEQAPEFVAEAAEVEAKTDAEAGDEMGEEFFDDEIHDAELDQQMAQAELSGGESGAGGPGADVDAEKPKAEVGDGELFEEFMEDVIAKRVRYNRYKSEIKMAYNRITIRKLNHFEILEVSPSAPMRDITKAYNKILKRYDQRNLLKERDKEYFEKADFVIARIKEAYQVLIDAKSRTQYSKEMKDKRQLAGEKKGLALKMFHEGMAFYRDNLYDKARESFRKAISYDSNNPVYYNMLETLEGQERQKESAKFFQAGKLTHERKGDTKRAIMLIRKAISIEPRSLYYLKLGEILSSDKSMTEDAIMAYDEALKMDPGNAELHSKIGVLKMQKKSTTMKEEALGHFVEALKWDERNEIAKKNKAALEAEGIKYKPKKESTSPPPAATPPTT